MVKTVFYLYRGKTIWVSLQFMLLNKLKNIFCFRCNLYKCEIKKICPHFMVTVQIFKGPATKERGNFKTCNFGIVFLQQFGTTQNGQLFIFQNHSTLLCSLGTLQSISNGSHARKFIVLKDFKKSLTFFENFSYSTCTNVFISKALQTFNKLT